MNKKRHIVKNKNSNPRISKNLALMILLIIVGMASILIWLNGEQEQNIADSQSQDPSTCQAHYYEGEAQVTGWLVSTEGKDLIVQVVPSDLDKLPKAADVPSDAKVKLVDASADIQKKLQDSTSDNPVSMTVKGYATVCDSLLPLVSLEPATKAFKKS